MNIFYYIKVLFGYPLEWLTAFTGNYGLALILFAVLVKIIFLPISAKSKKSTMKMSRVTPQVKALEEKYGDDKQKYQEAVTKLYKEEGVSTCGGCLWALIPLLILIPLYEVVRQPITWQMHLDTDTVNAVRQLLEGAGITFSGDAYWQMEAISRIKEGGAELLAQVQQIAPAFREINFSFLGINLGTIPEWKLWTVTLDWNNIGLFLIPLVSGGLNWLSMWISQKMNSTVITDEKGEKDEAMAKASKTSNGAMTLMMPIMSMIFGFIMPAGLSIYWIAQAVLGILQEYFLTKHYRKIYDAEDAIKQQKAAEEAQREAERERIRAERRQANPDGIIENTSKKKLQQKQKAEKAAAEAAYLAKTTPVEKVDPDCPSGDPERPFSRGRAYKADRYGENTDE